MRAALVVIVCACGRLGFETTMDSGSGDGGVDAAGDGSTVAACNGASRLFVGTASNTTPDTVRVDNYNVP